MTGQSIQSIPNEEVSKVCHTIQSSWQTVLSLQSVDCSYRVQKFSDEDCDDDSELGSYPWNSENRVVVLNNLNNRTSVCSFFIPHSSPNGELINVTFQQLGHAQSHQVHQADCYNLCNPGSTLYYPYSLKLHQSNGSIADGYYVEIFSKFGCDDENAITYENGEIVKVRHGANLAALTQNQPEILSYMIIHI